MPVNEVHQHAALSSRIATQENGFPQKLAPQVLGDIQSQPDNQHAVDRQDQNVSADSISHVCRISNNNAHTGTSAQLKSPPCRSARAPRKSSPHACNHRATTTNGPVQHSCSINLRSTATMSSTSCHCSSTFSHPYHMRLSPERPCAMCATISHAENNHCPPPTQSAEPILRCGHQSPNPRSSHRRGGLLPPPPPDFPACHTLNRSADGGHRRAGASSGGGAGAVSTTVGLSLSDEAGWEALGIYSPLYNLSLSFSSAASLAALPSFTLVPPQVSKAIPRTVFNEIESTATSSCTARGSEDGEIGCGHFNSAGVQRMHQRVECARGHLLQPMAEGSPHKSCSSRSLCTGRLQTLSAADNVGLGGEKIVNDFLARLPPPRKVQGAKSGCLGTVHVGSHLTPMDHIQNALSATNCGSSVMHEMTGTSTSPTITCPGDEGKEATLTSGSPGTPIVALSASPEAGASQCTVLGSRFSDPVAFKAASSRIPEERATGSCSGVVACADDRQAQTSRESQDAFQVALIEQLSQAMQVSDFPFATSRLSLQARNPSPGTLASFRPSCSELCSCICRHTQD
jgi:hypothetical protein